VAHDELLQALGQLYLEEDDQDELAAIGKYLLISTRYLNSIVHGQWGLTTNRERKVTLGVVHDLMWIRIYTLIDKKKETFAALGMDAAAQEQFVFTIELKDYRSALRRLLNLPTASIGFQRASRGGFGSPTAARSTRSAMSLHPRL
jgi:hypothetical protein